MERGGRWPGFARAGAPDTVVLPQQPDESAVAFADRVVCRITRLGTKRKRLEKLVLAIRSEESPELVDARSRIIGAAIEAAAGPDDADIVLSADDPGDDSERDEIFAFVAALSHLLPRNCALDVCFGRPLASVAATSSTTAG